MRPVSQIQSYSKILTFLPTNYTLSYLCISKPNEGCISLRKILKYLLISLHEGLQYLKLIKYKVSFPFHSTLKACVIH